MKLLNDGSTSNENRLGAVGSIQFAIDEAKLAGQPLLVVGGDTLLFDTFSIEKFMSHATDSDVDVLVTGEW